ncbi:kinesin-like protein KIF17 [Littorina saxatilis]|uniref:kinesin-like protein KIF17 n=1 Tax=Littorina saxatilis TaxID=31220 RepID=UPI0038B5CCDA
MSSKKAPDAAKPSEGVPGEARTKSNQAKRASPIKNGSSDSNRSLEKIVEEADTPRSVQGKGAQPPNSKTAKKMAKQPSKEKDSRQNSLSGDNGEEEEEEGRGDNGNKGGNSGNNNSRGNNSSGNNNGNNSTSDAATTASKAQKNKHSDSLTTAESASSNHSKDSTESNNKSSIPTTNSTTSPASTQPLPGRPQPLPAVNSGAHTSREGSHPGGAGKPPGITNPKGSVTSRANAPTSQYNQHHYNANSNGGAARNADAITMSAEEWRVKEDVPPWRRHGGDSTGGSTPGSRGSNPPGTVGSSRGDDGDSSYCGDDDAQSTGRKFTRKGGHRSNFGSSTTLSSATEVSDENGDGNFHVTLRVRPLSNQEKQRRDQFAATFPGDGQCAMDNNGSSRNFQFNVVFEPDAVQEDVFENCGIKRLVDNAVAGYTCTAFAFGQTGSGKTHTMTGPPSQFHQVGVTPDPEMYGIIQRSFKYMYQQIKQQGGGKFIRASYLEIYNEQVIDLLNNSHRRYLSVRWSKNKGFYVENLFTVECETLDDLMAVLEEGLRNRQTGSHGLNEFSSRSHSVLTVTIDSETQPDTEDENLYVTKRGKLSFVDLAGSEKVKDASGGFGGPGLSESNSINKSLLVLGNCISHLGDAKRRQGHIPYRDSKLTKLLSDSLAGNGITLMIACITPSSSNITETMNTLRYASRAKKIKSKPTVKMDPREKLIMNLKREIKVLRTENHYLRQQLDFPAKPKGQLQKENDEKFMKFMQEQKEKESGLYEMLQEYMVENENLRAENSEMHSTRDRIRREQQLLYRENERLMKRVEEMERVVSTNPAMWANTHAKRTDGYGQYDLTSPRGSPVGPGYHSGHKQHPAGAPVTMGSPPGSRGKVPGPMRPPHRLPDPVMRPAQRPAELVENGAMHPSNNGYVSPRAGPRQTSPTRSMERGASQMSTTDAIHNMNEKLKREVMQLEGQIRHHQNVRSPDGPRTNGHSVR